MNKELIEKLALIYANVNAQKGCTPSDVYALYDKAVKELSSKKDTNDLAAKIADPTHSL